MIARGKVVAILALLFLASSLTLANASRPRTPFYLRAIPTNMYPEWMHQADNQLVVAKIIEGGNVEFIPGQPVGTWTMDIVEIIRATGQATVSGHLVINFDSGSTIEGTVTARMPNFASQPPDVDGKFVGHGDMHAECDLYVIMEGNTPIIVLEGYSW